MTDGTYGESGCRLPLPKREDMDAAAQTIFDMLTDPEGDTLAGLWGPGGIRLHSPKLAVLAAPFNRYLRHEAEYGPRIRELAILVTAREMNSQFEWAAHEAEALRQGVSAEIVDIVKHRRDPGKIDATDAAVISLGREVFRERRVTPETYAAALDAFGPTTLVDLISLMGQYAATAVLLAAFDIQLKPGQEPLLP